MPGRLPHDVDLDTLDIPGLADLLEGSRPLSRARGRRARGAGPGLLREVLNALEDFDPTRLDPATVFHVHVTDTTLESGRVWPGSRSSGRPSRSRCATG